MLLLRFFPPDPTIYLEWPYRIAPIFLLLAAAAVAVVVVVVAVSTADTAAFLAISPGSTGSSLVTSGVTAPPSSADDDCTDGRCRLMRGTFQQATDDTNIPVQRQEPRKTCIAVPLQGTKIFAYFIRPLGRRTSHRSRVWAVSVTSLTSRAQQTDTTPPSERLRTSIPKGDLQGCPMPSSCYRTLSDLRLMNPIPFSSLSEENVPLLLL